jgi:hypothetical protein
VSTALAPFLADFQPNFLMEGISRLIQKLWSSSRTPLFLRTYLSYIASEPTLTADYPCFISPALVAFEENSLERI